MTAVSFWRYEVGYTHKKTKGDQQEVNGLQSLLRQRRAYIRPMWEFYVLSKRMSCWTNCGCMPLVVMLHNDGPTKGCGYLRPEPIPNACYLASIRAFGLHCCNAHGFDSPVASQISIALCSKLRTIFVDRPWWSARCTSSSSDPATSRFQPEPQGWDLMKEQRGERSHGDSRTRLNP